MIIRRWETPISDFEDLYFHRLIDEGKGKFEVETKEGIIFEVLIQEKTGPYIVVDEEFLTKYWENSPTGRGNTFIVEDSDFVHFFPGLMEPSEFVHYVVSTWSICLEVLSKEPPIIIRKVS